MSQTRQLAAIMFTDIVGYTALMGNNEQRAFDLLKQNREIHKPVIEEFGGNLIKELGDGIMASFPSVSNAASAAIKIQDACRAAAAFKLRIGLHQGEVVFENGDVFGDTVNIASRIQAAAAPEEIFVSESVHRDLMNKHLFRSEYVRTEMLKNVKDPMPVYRLSVAGSPLVSAVTYQRPTLLSVVPGFDCDIHISFRYDDNKSDGWVTEFAGRLAQELAATSKDKLSIYFDLHPEDCLNPLSDGSLPPPVNSLIFIPIISQTYCDESGPVWKQEFAGFLSRAKSDAIGMNLRNPGGSQVSRIIPVRIREVDPEDVRLLETVLSGGLRSIDFIYREDGVNRPLRPADDDKSGSVVRVMYRNQINKMAYAIKEVVAGAKAKQKQNETAAVQVIDRHRPSIYLAWTSNDLKESREEMAIILQKAGFNVLPSTDCPADDEMFKSRVAAEMQKCVCSLHMLSGEFGRRFESDDEISFPQYQFLESKKKVESPGAPFNVFVWMAQETPAGIRPAQQRFIKDIRNNITRNMMFSNSHGAMQLVDDIRVVIMKEDAKVYDSRDTDIFFIFNQQDEAEAQVIINELSLELPVETMNILPDGEDSYREMSSQQIPKSRLAVVYFKYAADWALPFIKQIWKQVGGASSPTPMFLVGEDDPYSNLARNFRAPRVTSSIVPKETISEEVKKLFKQLP